MLKKKYFSFGYKGKCEQQRVTFHFAWYQPQNSGKPEYFQVMEEALKMVEWTACPVGIPTQQVY